MLLLSRFDYSRLRELASSASTGDDRLDPRWCSPLGAATRGSQALRSSCRSSASSRPSSGKVLLILTLSAFVVDRMRRLGERETTSRIMLLALVPGDARDRPAGPRHRPRLHRDPLGALFVAGTKWTHFAALGALAATAIVLVLVAAPAVGVEVLKPYQVDRLTAFVNPTDNPAEEGYQSTSRMIADRLGQKTGRGDEATQTKLDFLPEHHTDFVFSRGGRGVRLHGGGDRPVAVRPADLEVPANPHDVEEPVRRVDSRGHHCHADVPDLRQRGHDHRDHAHHRSHPAAR